MNTDEIVDEFVSHMRPLSVLVTHACMLSCFSRVQLLVTLWTVVHQAPLSMEFSRQEYWSGLPCPPPGDLPCPGIEPGSVMPPASAGGFLTTSTTWEAHVSHSVLSTCCDPMDYTLPGSSIHGILQTRILKWVFPSPEDLPDQEIEPRSPVLQADSLLSEPPEKLSLY